MQRSSGFCPPPIGEAMTAGSRIDPDHLRLWTARAWCGWNYMIDKPAGALVAKSNPFRLLPFISGRPRAFFRL